MAWPDSPCAYDEVVAIFANGPGREEINGFRLSPETNDRVRELLLKKSAGTLTDEADELDQCVQFDRLLLLIRSKALELRAARGA